MYLVCIAIPVMFSILFLARFFIIAIRCLHHKTLQSEQFIRLFRIVKIEMGQEGLHRLRVKAPAVLKLPRCPLIGIQPASIQLTGHLPPNTASAQSMPNAAWLVSAMTLLATPDTYQSESYYMRYRPTDTADCYAFETRTVTDNGQVKTGDYCR